MSPIGTILIVALSGFLMGFDGSLFTGALVFVKGQFALTELELGWTTSSHTITATIAIFFAGKVFHFGAVLALPILLSERTAGEVFGAYLLMSALVSMAFVYVAMGLEPVPVPVLTNCFIYINGSSALFLVAIGLSPIGPFPLDAAGGAVLPIAIPANPSLVGQRLDLQALATDGITTTISNGLTLNFF